MNSITETLRKADDYYQKAIILDTNKNYKDALVLYDNAKKVYESVYNSRKDIESTRLNLVETNLKSIYNRINQLNNILQKYQQQQQQQQNPVQIMYPQVPVPPASYAGVQNFPPNSNYPPQGQPLYSQLPSLCEIGNMNGAGSPTASPQTSYPQFNSAMMQQEANPNQQPQYYYQQGQAPNQIQQQQQNQIPAQLYQQPQSQQNIQQPQFLQQPSGDQHQPATQSNPPLPPSHEDNHRQKGEKKKFHFGKKKNKDEDEDKESSKKKKHDKKHDDKDKNKQLHDQDQQNQGAIQQPQQNSNQYPNQQQPNWQQVLQINTQPNHLIQNQIQPQFPQQQLIQSQLVQQQMMQQQQMPPQSQLHQQPPQSYQSPQPYQIQYPQPQQFQMQQQFNQQQQQAPSREISINNNNIQAQNNSDSVSYDSGYDYDQDKSTSSTRKRAHHVLMSDQIIQPKDYTVKRILGKGANGIVYLVSDVHTNKEYAMKELLHQLISSEEQKSFFREIELMIHANHPAVLKLIGFSMTNAENKNSPILILELMPNGSLQDVIEKKKSFTLTQKYIALYGIAEAMKYLHSKDIVHRDLKPANVLLNQFDEPAVADFGLSKLMSQDMMRQTQAAGSPVYMAPELMMRQDYNNSIDVYAYGYICYELLLEELSFSNVTNVYDLVNMVCNGSRPPLNGKNLDDKWKTLISNCWDANPYERPTFHQICQLFIERTLPFNNVDMNRFAQYEAKIRTKK